MEHGIKELKISDNQLMNDNNRVDFLPGLLNKLKGIEYDIFDTELVGYGGFNPLQKVDFQTGNTNYSSYVFNNEIEITQGYKEVIYTDPPQETATDYKSADKTDKRVNQLYIIANKQEKKITALASEVNQYDEKINTLEMTVDSTILNINHKYDFLREKEGENQLKLDDSLEYQPISYSLQGHTKKILYLYPSNDLYPSDDLYPLGVIEGSCE